MYSSAFSSCLKILITAMVRAGTTESVHNTQRIQQADHSSSLSTEVTSGRPAKQECTLPMLLLLHATAPLLLSTLNLWQQQARCNRRQSVSNGKNSILKPLQTSILTSGRAQTNARTYVAALFTNAAAASTLGLQQQTCYGVEAKDLNRIRANPQSRFMIQAYHRHAPPSRNARSSAAAASLMIAAATSNLGLVGSRPTAPPRTSPRPSNSQSIRQLVTLCLEGRSSTWA